MSDVGGISGSSGTGGTGSSGPLTAAAALAALKAHTVTSATITDSAANIAKNLDALQAYASKITAITASGSSTSLTVTGTQYQKDGALLAIWGAGSGQTVAITAAKANISTTLPSYVSSVTVADSSTAIATNLDHLQTLAAGGLLQQIVQVGTPANLSITTAQLSSDQAALGLIKNQAYTLAITGATVSDVLGLGSNPALANNAKVKSIAIVDSTDAIANNLDALERVGLRIKSITQTDVSTPLTVTGDQYRQDKFLLGRFVSSDILAVIDASASQAKQLSQDHKVVTVDVQDTAANISRNWAMLQSLGSDLTSVTVTDQANDVQLTGDQLANGSALLGKFVDTQDQSYKLAVTGVSAGNAASVAATHNVDTVSISDTSANIVAGLDDLETLVGQGKVGTVATSTPNTAMAMDVSRFQGDALTATQSVLDKMKGHNYAVSVSGAAVADVAALTANKHIVSFSVGDTAANLQSGLATLRALGGRLAGIEQSDSGTALSLTQAQMDGNTAVLAKIGGGYTANLTAVTAAKAASDALNGHVASIAVSDTGRNIASYWNTLRTLGSTLQSVTQSDSTALSLTADNYQQGVNDQLVAKLGGGSTFDITGASSAQAVAIGGDQAVAQIDVVDTGANIVDNISGLATLASGGKLNSIMNQTSASLAMDASQLATAQPVLDLIKGGSYTLTLSGVDVGDAKALVTGNSKIASVAVTGTAADIVSNLADLSSLGRKLTEITQSDGPGTLLDMSETDFEKNQVALGKIDGGFLATLSDVVAAKAANLANNAQVSSLSVTDTGANLASAFAALSDVGDKLTAVTQSDSATLQLGYQDWINGQDLRAKFASDPTVSISGVAVANVDALAADSAVQAIQVQDSSDAVSAGISDLAAQTNLTQIVLADSTAPLTLSAQDYTDNSAVLGLIKNGQYSAALSDVAAGDAGTFAADSHVSSMDVTDTAAAVASNWDALAGASNLNSINLSDSGNTITLTGTQILNGASTLAMIDGSYQLAATNVATADLPNLQDVPQMSSISISDSADNVSSNFGDVLGLGGQLTQIHLTDSSPVLSLSEQDWTAGTDALATIDAPYQVNVSNVVAGDAQTVAADSTVATVQVADTASNIAGNWDALVNLYGAGKLTGLALSDANTLTLTSDQQSSGAAMIAALMPDETIQTA